MRVDWKIWSAEDKTLSLLMIFSFLTVVFWFFMFNGARRMTGIWVILDSGRGRMKPWEMLLLMSSQRSSWCSDAPLWLANIRASYMSCFQLSLLISVSGQWDPLLRRFLNNCHLGWKQRRGSKIERGQNSDPYPIGESLFALIAFSRLKLNLRSMQ